MHMEEGSNFVEVKRERSASKSDTDVIKIKRSETPDDILSALLKEDAFDKGDDVENDYETIEHDVRDEEGYDTKEDDVHNGKDHEQTEDGDEKRSHLRRHVSHGYHLVEGKMKHGMEDYLVATRKEIDGHELGLYAIFDGYSGREPDFLASPKTTVERAYEATDNDVLKNVVGSRGGSTAVTAILINREKLVVANVGDSRAVLCRNGTAKQITVDHEPLKERKQVESKGVFVSKKPGNVPRVDGQLAMTRAFGDERLQEHITAEPDIVIEKIDDGHKIYYLSK